ncbi:hypothetical protein C2W62_04820 [Candidatus Entotheonella serta]|nr:hypothetical protein C2W62_04820 [Candidatus Entotheonella serta]
MLYHDHDRNRNRNKGSRAQTGFTTAAALYRTLDMPSWLSRVETIPNHTVRTNFAIHTLLGSSHDLTDTAMDTSNMGVIGVLR